jgi:ribosomal protein S18 acetylase RimI-like enzyme
MHSIRTATPADIPAIQRIAEITWWHTYADILPAAQLDYMLNAIYSTQALENCWENGSQTFILLTDEHGQQGFAAFGSKSDSPKIYKLHKLYVMPDNHGKGYGKTLIEEVKKRIIKPGENFLDLNVNRYNPAKRFYEKLGFVIIGEEDVPIGGYWMNDYVMRLTFKA